MFLDTAKREASLHNACFEASCYEIQLIRLYKLLLLKYSKYKNSVVTVSDAYVVQSIPEPYVNIFLELADYTAYFEQCNCLSDVPDYTTELEALAALIHKKLNPEARANLF